jgi:tetratricopeptide (TPR) repeat protein
MSFRRNVFLSWMCFCLLGCGLDEQQQQFLEQVQSHQQARESVVSGLVKEAQKAIGEKRFPRAAHLVRRARIFNPDDRQLDKFAWQATALEVLSSNSVDKTLLVRLGVDRSEAELRKIVPLPLMLLAQCIADIAANRTDDAKQTLLKLVTVEASEFMGQKARVFLELGKLNVRSDALDEAVNRFHETLAEDDSVWDARLHLVQLLSQKGSHKLAVEQGETLVKQKQDGVTFFVFGRALDAAGEQARAVTAFEQALGFKNAPVVTLSELGKVYFSQRNFKNAQVTFSRAFQLTGSVSDKFNEGIAFKGAKAFEASAGSFEQVIQLKPDSPRAHAELIGALLTAKRYQLVRQAFSRYLKLKAKHKTLESVNAEITAMLKPAVKQTPPVPKPTDAELSSPAIDMTPRGAPSQP